jgi:transcriptional regulator with XRE-family HTH domain
MDAVEFGLYLKKLREENRMSLRKLSRISGLSFSYISHMEHGRRGIPNPSSIKKLSTALKVSYQEMMTIAGHLQEEDEALVELAKTLKEVIKDSKTIDLKNLDQYKFEFNGQPLSPELAKQAMQYIRFLVQQQKPSE